LAVKASALVARLALAAGIVVGAVACKKEAEPAQAASSEKSGGGGETSQAGAETSAGANRNAQLPAKPRKLPSGELADPEAELRKWRRGEGPPPDRAEMRAKRDERRKEALAMYDNDKDGELNDDERALMHEARVADMVARIDQNADGRLTREELDASATNRRRPPPDFETIDTNKDGFVTVEEFAAARPPRNFRDRRDEPPPPAPSAPPAP
jgi:hypothetical protein